MPIVKIEAFTFEFNEVQDRICLSGNLYNAGQEISFWLTRRLALRLLNAATDLIEKTSPSIANAPLDHRSAMALFEHQNAQIVNSEAVEFNKKKPELSDDFENNSKLIVEPEILNRLDISFKNKAYNLSFFTSSKESAAAVSAIDYNQLHQILSFIHKGALKLDWGVEASLFVTPDQTAYTLQ
ncbi:MAG: hypothetical protein ACI9ES_002075 [Oceanospirillaceae bacterium]|jgi:hypothetical protein